MRLGASNIGVWQETASALPSCVALLVQYWSLGTCRTGLPMHSPRSYQARLSMEVGGLSLVERRWMWHALPLLMVEYNSVRGIATW